MDWMVGMERMEMKLLNDSVDIIDKYWDSSDYKEWLRFSHRNDYIQRPIGYWKCYCDKDGNVSWEYIKS